MIVMSNVALKAGSSQHGKARRASGACFIKFKIEIIFQNNFCDFKKIT